MSNYGSRFDRAKAAAVIERVMGISPPGGRLDVAGSYRRGRPTVGDVDLVIDGTNFFWVETLLREIAHLAGEANCHRTKDGKLKRVTIEGVPVELYVSKPGAWGGMWLFTVGSGDFNCWQRAIANRKGLMLSQYGLFEPEIDHKGKRVAGKLVAGAEEIHIFEALGMPFIEPEDREPGRFGR